MFQSGEAITLNTAWWHCKSWIIFSSMNDSSALNLPLTKLVPVGPAYTCWLEVNSLTVKTATLTGLLSRGITPVTLILLTPQREKQHRWYLVGQNHIHSVPAYNMIPASQHWDRGFPLCYLI